MRAWLWGLGFALALSSVATSVYYAASSNPEAMFAAQACVFAGVALMLVASPAHHREQQKRREQHGDH